MKLNLTILLFVTSMIITAPSFANDGVVYVVLFMHNEDGIFNDFDNPATKTAYLRNRQTLVQMAQYLHTNSVSFAWQSDWKFLEGVLKYETAELMASTGSKNLVRWLREDMEICVDAHSHEHYGYNYADVACLLDSLGVTTTNIIGGHIWDPYNENYANWERFHQPLQGSRFPHYFWEGKVLIGSGTPNHTYDPQPSGIWRPTDKYNYWQDDPDGDIMCIGQYTGDIEGVEELVNLYRSDAVPEGKILTCTIHTPQNLHQGFMDDFRQNLIEPLLALQDSGDIKIVDYVELVEIWQNEFSGSAHLYNAPGVYIPPQFGVRVPCSVAGQPGLYVQVSIPTAPRFNDITAPVVVHVAGGWNGIGVTNKLHRLTEQGFLELDFNFPGSGYNNQRSGGFFDERGEYCIRAAADVIKFAMGLEKDIYGYYIGDMIGDIQHATDNTGLCGWSNGGNATITAAGAFGNEFPGLAWIVNWESPVGDGMPNVDAGVHHNLNPAYDPGTGKFDTTMVAYAGSLETTQGDWGALYFDADRNGTLEAGIDFLAPYHYYSGKCYYSQWLRKAAETLGETLPQHIATVEETDDFWHYRNGEKWIESAVELNPGLMFIVEAGDHDHVQGAPDHPHVLIQYNGFLNTGTRFVRLNPDRYYVEQVLGVPAPQAVDNDGFATFDHQTIQAALQPRSIPGLESGLSVAAAICELADRTKDNNTEPQIDQATGISDDLIHKPEQLRHFYNYPNPFHSTTTIYFDLTKDKKVLIEILNLNGQRVNTLINKVLPSGNHQIDWYGNDSNGNSLPPGMYYCKIKADNYCKSWRMIYLE